MQLRPLSARIFNFAFSHTKVGEKLALILIAVTAIPHFSIAAPGSEAPIPLSKEIKNSKNEKPEYKTEPQGIILVKPFKNEKKDLKKKKARPGSVEFFGFQKQGSAMIGLRNFDGSSHISFGGYFLFLSEKLWNHEIGADLYGNNSGSFHWGLRRIFSRFKFFRPYYKLGAGISATGSDGIAFLIKLSNYQARASVGLEQTFHFFFPASYRVEAQTMYQTSGLSLQFRAGISWAWN